MIRHVTTRRFARSRLSSPRMLAAAIAAAALGCSPAPARLHGPSQEPAEPRVAPAAPSQEVARAESGDRMAPSRRLETMNPLAQGNPSPSAADLSGVWHEVPMTASPGPLRRPPPCYEGLGWVALEQIGKRIQMLRRFAEPAQGYVPVENVETHESGAGTRHGDRIELDAELVREVTPIPRFSPSTARASRTVLESPHWTLTFDHATGHLVGTRAGVAVRLAPLVIVEPPGEPARYDRCGSPPP